MFINFVHARFFVNVTIRSITCWCIRYSLVRAVSPAYWRRVVDADAAMIFVTGGDEGYYDQQKC